MKAAFAKILSKTGSNPRDFVGGIIISAIFILLSFQSISLFESIERFLYGIEMRFALAPTAGAGNIAIVNIDEKSLNEIGSWPWPRSKIAEMIKILNDNGARLVGLDLEGLNNREPNQGLKGLKEIKDLYDELYSSTDERDNLLKAKLKEIEDRLDNDQILRRTIKETGNVILPVSGRNDESDSVLDQDAFSTINRIKLNVTDFDQEKVFKVKNLIMPFPELALNCLGLGHIDQTPDKKMVGRKHLLFFDFNNSIIPSMAFKLALEYLGKGNSPLSFKNNGIDLSGTTIPSPDGNILIRFKGARRSYPYYSFVNILKVKQVPSLFNDKIVLIGRTERGSATINTPVDNALPNVEFIANVIDNILNERFIERPKTMTYVEAFILFMLVMIFSIVFPKTTHINRIGITIGLCFAVIIAGVISFITLDIWFKSVYIFSAFIIFYIQITVRDLIASQKMMAVQSEEFKESSRMLGLSFQSQGLLDLAFEKFRKCDLDNSMKDVIYNLGLDYERKRMVNKAISVYEYIAEKDSSFRDLKSRIPKLREAIGSVEGKKAKKDEKILVVDDLEIKPTVGRYEIIKEIGQGAMGVVYEANDPKINRHLAIKTIRFSDEFKDDKIREIKNRFFKEAEIAGKLSHPAIVSIYDAGEDYDLTYLAMEYLDGVDLREFCKKGSLQPLRKVLYIVSEVALALDHAHNMGVIHRDIKPGNIMLLKNGKVKVTDFGIAKAISTSETKSGVVLGTPNYMSPEQINGQTIDGRSDIFALGVVLYELLSGTLPFFGKNITSLLYQITQGKQPEIRTINPKIPKVCAQIIDRALEKKPENRFQNGSEMAKYLKATLNKMDQAGKSRS